MTMPWGGSPWICRPWWDMNGSFLAGRKAASPLMAQGNLPEHPDRSNCRYVSGRDKISQGWYYVNQETIKNSGTDALCLRSYGGVRNPLQTALRRGGGRCSTWRGPFIRANHAFILSMPMHARNIMNAT